MYVQFTSCVYEVALKVSGLRLISSIQLDGREDIQIVISTKSIFHAELKPNANFL